MYSTNLLNVDIIAAEKRQNVISLVGFIGLVIGVGSLLLGSLKFGPPIEMNIDKARRERALQIAKIMVEGLNQVAQKTPNGGLPDEFKNLLKSYYAESFQKIENLPDEVIKYERLRYKLIYSQLSLLLSVVAFATSSILSYIGIDEAILPVLIIAWSFLIIALGIFIYIGSQTKWT